MQKVASACGWIDTGTSGMSVGLRDQLSDGPIYGRKIIMNPGWTDKDSLCIGVWGHQKLPDMEVLVKILPALKKWGKSRYPLGNLAEG